MVSLVTTIAKFDERRVTPFTSSISMPGPSSCCWKPFAWSSLLRRAVRAAQGKSSEVTWPFCAVLVSCCRPERYITAATNRQGVRGCVNCSAAPNAEAASARPSRVLRENPRDQSMQEQHTSCRYSSYYRYFKDGVRLRTAAKALQQRRQWIPEMKLTAL